jgi:uncharacterized membrane protein HdeD (DUF308 family)
MASSTTYQVDTLGFDPDELSKNGLNAIRTAVGILGVLGVVLGLALVVWPGKSLVVLAAIVGAYFVLAGVVRIALGIFSREVSGGFRVLNLLFGILLVLGGVIALRNLTASAAVLTLVTAILIGVGWIVQGIMAFVAVGKGKASGWAIAGGVIGVLAGIVVLAVPGWSIAWLVIITGVVLLIMGIFGIVQAFTLGRSKAAA